MNDTPSPFSTDLYHLWEAGHIYLPLVADCYADGTAELATIDNSPTAATRASGEIPDVVYPALAELSQLAQVMFSRIATNLYDVGEALEQAAFAFAEQDNETRNGLLAIDELKDQIDERAAWVEEGRTNSSGDKLPDRPDSLSKPYDVDNSDDLLPEDR